MIRNITHGCGEKLGAFDSSGRILNAANELLQIGTIAAVYEAAFHCARCGGYYVFNGRQAVKKQRKIITSFEVNVFEMKKEKKK